MPQFINAMEIFKLLNKSNCRKCNETTCLAFAASVFQGKRQLDDCPDLDQRVKNKYSGQASSGSNPDNSSKNTVSDLQGQIENIDLINVAEKLGGTYANDRLTLKIMGKAFSVDSQGNFYTDIHVHEWISIPVLNYILNGQGKQPSGKWVPLRELPSGRDWYRLFRQRCEIPIKKVADTYTDFFDDMIHLFSGSQVDNYYSSDISVVLSLLPKVPILICYWKSDEGMGSDLHLFFDETAESNLNIESLYSLGAGMALMFEKLSQRHAQG